jgi:glycosyltransferase involved in cell wall biosynthesis
LHLLYTGRFYPFRDPAALLEAVLAVEGTRLTIVGPEMKASYLAYAERSGGRIAFLGEQPHARVLELQRDCDVLVNIGNATESQVPGKLFEYLGTGKPILHCQSVDRDPASALIAQWSCGWVCRNDRASLQTLLRKILPEAGDTVPAPARDDNEIARYGWSRLGASLFERCEQLVANRKQLHS